jgi:hypothetical protein
VSKRTRLALVDLLVHASSAARLVGHLGNSDDALKQLSNHIRRAVHGGSALLDEHRLIPELAPDETAVIDELRHFMGMADALASTTDEQFSRIVVLTDGDDRRGFKRLAHLVGMTALAVSAASDASSKLIAAVELDLVRGRT